MSGVSPKRPEAAVGQEEIDRLFEVSPEDFVSERDRVSRSLKDGGQGELAAEVKKLRKPTLPAWTINQLVRRRRKDVEALLELGQELRHAQRGADAAGVRALGQRRRAMLSGLVTAAADIADEQGTATDATRRAVEDTLETALADPGAGEEVLAGRLTRPMEGGTGFDAVGAALTVVPGGAEKPDPAAELRAEENRLRRSVEEARRRLAEAEDDVRRAEMRADTLAADAAKIAARTQEAGEQVKARKAARTEAKREVQKAERALKRATEA
jgi:DNA repair exonuclease SbcCD ATPase subunit